MSGWSQQQQQQQEPGSWARRARLCLPGLLDSQPGCRSGAGAWLEPSQWVRGGNPRGWPLTPLGQAPVGRPEPRLGSERSVGQSGSPPRRPPLSQSPCRCQRPREPSWLLVFIFLTSRGTRIPGRAAPWEVSRERWAVLPLSLSGNATGTECPAKLVRGSSPTRPDGRLSRSRGWLGRRPVGRQATLSASPHCFLWQFSIWFFFPKSKIFCFVF